MEQDRGTASTRFAAHPYSELPEHAFWSRSMSDIAPYAVDPVVDVPFRISKFDLVATAGSCFAQHISRALIRQGYRYFVTEPGQAELSPEEGLARNYGVFSARYGNIYTTRQLLQLFDRAYGAFKPSLSTWRGKNGNFVDPFRPRIEPQGFATEAELAADRARHLACVRSLFESLDVFVFTLGLTEGWENRADHASLPLAPGVAGGEWDPRKYEFRNYSVQEVEQDLAGVIDRLRVVNPISRVVLTVSPVPLIATYEARHVLASTCLSKSVLRVAAESCARRYPNVCYFPAYEIITGPHSGSRYFEDDLRSINKAGVDHVMRVFFGHFEASSTQTQAPATSQNYIRAEVDAMRGIVCDEEVLDR